MEGRERDEGAKIIEHGRRHDAGPRISCAAVYDAMADAEHARPAVARAQPLARASSAAAAVLHRCVERGVGERRTAAVLRGETRRGPDAVDLAARREPPPLPLGRR
jgi:hypothetical protein